ncbi:MAG TPA: class F sortase [Pseudonocardia sp.]|nr:class F sortase [Pseudonocardia sp.]
MVGRSARHGPGPTRLGRSRTALAGALAALVVAQVLTGLGYLFVLTTVPPELGLRTGPRSPSVGPPRHLAPTGEPAPAAVDPGGPLRATDLDIPKLGIRSTVLELGVDATGALQPPAEPDVVGWFSGAAAPGEQGPTVIAGHVDSRTGPGIFFDLKDLARGDLVEVGRSDGRTATYRVTGVQVVDKDRFPTQQVYGPTAGAELRLITCGGTFDRTTGHYLRNVVVSGMLVDPS